MMVRTNTGYYNEPPENQAGYCGDGKLPRMKDPVF
jgi:hypothetical protein